MSDLDLVALKPMKYLTRRLQPGDTFEAKNRRDARVYCAINKACSPDDPRAAQFKTETKADAPAPAPEPVDDEPKPKPKKAKRKTKKTD